MQGEGQLTLAGSAGQAQPRFCNCLLDTLAQSLFYRYLLSDPCLPVDSGGAYHRFSTELTGNLSTNALPSTTVYPVYLVYSVDTSPPVAIKSHLQLLSTVED